MERTAKWYGKYRGVVTDNQDPSGQGRIKARVPDVLGEVETNWALPCAPYAGDGSGAYLVPAPGTGVWMEFEAGDVNRPIWSGCCWSGGQTPRGPNGAPAAPPLKMVRSETGLLLTLDDQAQQVTLSDASGSNCLCIDVQGGSVKIKAAARVVVEAPQVEWVPNATQPAVLGDALLQYLNQLVAVFNSHLHVGQHAAGVLPVTAVPPLPPFPPAGAALLSKKVKVG
jgi:uncharacterized protein involved in type VI secretion and phage assembly